MDFLNDPDLLGKYFNHYVLIEVYFSQIDVCLSLSYDFFNNSNIHIRTLMPRQLDPSKKSTIVYEFVNCDYQ